MLGEKLNDKRIILASGSPRRHQFFKELNIPFEVRLKSVEELYPPELKASQIANYLAELKASAFDGELLDHEILVTSDTIVWHNGASLAKAADEKEAIEMLHTLSGDWHEVITAVCFTTTTTQKTVNASTRVKFKSLTGSYTNVMGLPTHVVYKALSSMVD